MVSLSRLLAAAANAPAPERAASTPLQKSLSQCILPPTLSTISVPARLRLALSDDSPNEVTDPQPSQTLSTDANIADHLPLQHILKDLGPEATASENMSTLANALALFGRPSEASVASALLFLTTSSPNESSVEDGNSVFQLFSLFCANPNPSSDPALLQAISTNYGSQSEWDRKVFVHAVTSVAAKFNMPLDWRLVIRALDIEGLENRLTQSVFREIANAYELGTGGSLLPADSITEKWQHPPAQLSMLAHALSSPTCVDWSVLDGFEGATAEDLAIPYSRVDVTEKLVELDARDLLQNAKKENADVLLLSLTCAKPASNTNLQQKLTVALLTPLISSFPSSAKALQQMWNVSPALVEAGIISLWKKDVAMLRKALEIGLELHVLPDLLSASSALEFSLDLAVLAYREDVLKLEPWLAEFLALRGMQAVSLCTLYLLQRVHPPESGAKIHPPVDAVRIIVRCLVAAIGSVGGAQTQELMEGVRKALEAYRTLDPRFVDLSPDSDLGDRTVLVGSNVGASSGLGVIGGMSSVSVSQPGSTLAASHVNDSRGISMSQSIPTGVSTASMPSSLGMSGIGASSIGPLVPTSGAALSSGASSIPSTSFVSAGPPPPMTAAPQVSVAPGAAPPVVGASSQSILPIAVDQIGISEAASTAAAFFLAEDGSTTGFTSEVEQQADKFFNDLYRGDMPNEQAVSILRNAKANNTGLERGLFNCVLHTLFDEYRFFKKYPDRELRITGMLFGSIIQHSLVDGNPLALALSCVLDALRTVEPHPQPIGRLTKFGICALERIRPRLSEWPHYCAKILSITRLSEFVPELFAEVKRSVQNPIANQAANISNTTSSVSNALPVPGDNAQPSNYVSVPNVDRSNEPAVAADNSYSSAIVAGVDATNDVQKLLSSPPMSITNTPVKPSKSSTSLRGSPSVVADGTLGVSALNLSVYLGMNSDEASEVVEPDETTQDKIKFIFNNLSTTTMDDKVTEMLSILRPEYQRYFSVYIVVKRASSESNFHNLYLTMLDRIDPHLPSLFPMVYDTSFRRVRVLLSGDKIKITSTERLVLKSLGSWIGSLTLARNKPITRKDLDLKELLMHAYSKGRLTTVIPFVSKVMEACPRSLIFKTTNPWVRGILGLLQEICSVDNLKLNMRFELQLLCKTLGVKDNELVASDLLKFRPAPDKTNNPDFNTKKQAGSSPQNSPSPTASPSPVMERVYMPSGAPSRPGVPVFTLSDAQPSMSPHGITLGPSQPPPSPRMEVPQNLMSSNLRLSSEVPSDMSSLLMNANLPSNMATSVIPRSSVHVQESMGMQSPRASAARAPALPAESMLVPNLAQFIHVNPSLVLFQSSPHLKRLIPVAIDRAIKEIIQPVVDRSCAIAFLTTKELTIKDFANEADLNKVKWAALQMVQQLAESLALVTSKEPLRVSMGNQLRIVLSSPVASEQALVDQTVQVLCNANLDVGCAIIKRHAKERAARDLNEKIGPAFATRRPQQSAYNYGSVPGPDVHRVYEEFSRLHNVSAPQPQYETFQTVTSPPSHTVHAPPPLIQAPNSSSLQNAHFPSRAVHSIPPQRINGNPLDANIDLSAASLGPSAVEVEHIDDHVVPQRRAPVPSPNVSAIAEVAPPVTAYGTAVPQLASSTSVASAILAAAGSSGTSAGGSSHSLGGGPGAVGSVPGEEALSTQQVLERFNSIYPQLTAMIADVVSDMSSDATLSGISADHEIHSLWVKIPTAVKRSVTADEAGMAVAQKVFHKLYEGESDVYREVHVLILEGLRESCRRLPKELSTWLAFSEERKKLNRECIVALLKPRSLLNITAYDEVLAKAIDNGRNAAALDFASFLVHRAVIEEPLATAAEMYVTLEAMAKVGRRSNPPYLPSCPEGLTALVEAARNVVHKPSAPFSSPSSVAADANKTTRESEPLDPAGAREFVAGSLLEWHRILSSDSPTRPVSENVVSSFLGQLRAGTLTSEESRERFFRLTVELAAAVTRAALQSRNGRSSVAHDLSEAPYTVVDSTVRLVGSLCRPDADGSTNGVEAHGRDVGILCHFFAALVKDLLKGYATSDLRPHFRFFSGLIGELAIGCTVKNAKTVDFCTLKDSYFNSGLADLLAGVRTRADAVQFLDDKANGYFAFVRNSGGLTGERDMNLDNVQVIAAVVGALSVCTPDMVPPFVFSWLQLISNKELLPTLLSLATTYGWPLFKHLIVRMIEFLSSYLSVDESTISEGVRTLYGGLLRVLLVLLHDFPEFLCAYHMSLCDAMPQNCVQLRNLVLASFPKDMRLPDPFLPELKIEELPDMVEEPLVMSEYMKHIDANGMRGSIDKFVHGLAEGASLGGIDVEMIVSGIAEASGERRYDVRAIGAAVMYIGQFAITRGRMEGVRSATIGTAATQLLRKMTRELEAEGRHYVLNGIANQLRYPNNNTMYFSSLMLLLFQEAEEDCVKEQITRVLVERLIANRPHPWGLLITFVQLIKNSEYNFWGHGFVRCAPEIEQLFENVAKFCVGPVVQAKPQSFVAAPS